MNLAPSIFKRYRFQPDSPEYPPIWYFAANTRWQGMIIGIGLAPQALPTALHALGLFS